MRPAPSCRCLLLACAGLFALASAFSADEPPRGEPADLMIRGAIVVTMDGAGRVLENGAVAVRGERILAVGPAAELAAKFQAKKTIDAAGRVAMPGLINTHTHVPMTLLRGLADDLPLMEWLQKTIFPAEAKNVDEAFVRAGTRLGCLEMIRSGTTTYVDMYYFEHAIAEETQKAGLRGVLGQTVLDFPMPDKKNWSDAMAGVEEFVRRWKGDPLITPAIAPHAPYTVSPDHLKEAHAFAKRYEVPLLIHVGENEDEVNAIRKKHGCTPVAYLDGLGVLDERVLAAHAVWTNGDDFKILAARKVGVAHCPQSNMKLASGTAPVPAMVKAGVNVGLGTDGAASNNLLDMFREMDMAAKLHKLATKNAAALPAREALELATIRGARALGREKDLGSLEPGKLSDLILVRMDAPHQAPLHNVQSQLVYATLGSDVETVIVHGKLLMENRKLLTLDEPAILAEAGVWRDRVRKSLAGKP